MENPIFIYRHAHFNAENMKILTEQSVKMFNNSTKEMCRSDQYISGDSSTSEKLLLAKLKEQNDSCIIQKKICFAIGMTVSFGLNITLLCVLIYIPLSWYHAKSDEHNDGLSSKSEESGFYFPCNDGDEFVKFSNETILTSLCLFKTSPAVVYLAVIVSIILRCLLFIAHLYASKCLKKTHHIKCW